jgi:hypothetical protein
MHLTKEELITSSKSHCRVGKITPKQNTAVDSDFAKFDFKTEAFKKSAIRFTENTKKL